MYSVLRRSPRSRAVQRKSNVAAIALLTACIAAAHGPITTRLTWTRDISRIVYRRCLDCHRDGGSAPMPLLTYEQARPWAKAIQEEVLERRMPPWGAVKGFGDFQDDLGLTQEELHLLSDWVDGGAPEGDPKYLPDPPSARRAIPEPAPRSLAVRGGSLVLAADAIVVAITPEGLRKGSTHRVVARLPDSSIEPLLWVYDYNPKFARSYRYRMPLRLPAGTRIERLPPASGRVWLSTANAAP